MNGTGLSDCINPDDVEEIIVRMLHSDETVSQQARGTLQAMLGEYHSDVDREQVVRFLLRLTALDQPLQTRWTAMRVLKRLPRDLILRADRAAREAGVQPGKVIDGLRRMEISVPEKVKCHRCVATVISPGYENQLDMMLASLARVGEVEEAGRVVFLVDPDAACWEIARKYNVHVFEARSLVKRPPAVKGCLYTLYDCVEADSYVLLEADLLILDSLRPLFEQMEKQDRAVVAAVGAAPFSPDDVNGHRNFDAFYSHALCSAEEDWRWLTGRTDEDRPRVFSYANGGLIACNRAGMERMTNACRELQPFFHTWMDCAPEHVHFRDEFCFNMIAALEDMIFELPSRYNIQLQSPIVHPRVRNGRVYHNDELAAVLHFAGERGKGMMPTYLRDLGLEATM